MIKNCANLSICEIISRLIRADKPFSNEDYFNQDTYFSVQNLCFFVKKIIFSIEFEKATVKRFGREVPNNAKSRGFFYINKQINDFLEGNE